MEYLKAKELPQSPRERANIFSYMCFCWVLPVFFKGRKRELNHEDLYRALDAHKSGKLGARLTAAWQRQLDRKKTLGREPSLLRAVFSVFGWEIAFLGLALFAIEFFIRMPQPVLLGGLISFYSTAGGNINEAYAYAGAVVLCSALAVVFLHPLVLTQLHCGMKIRVAVCSMIYRKSLKLSKNALGDTTAGQVVNLLSNDVSRLDLTIMFMHYLWVGPLETVIVSYLMYREIGVAAFGGVAFMMAFIPLQAYLGRKTSRLRLKTALLTDERVRMMNEIVQGVQVIKMYAWEKPFGRMVALARLKEINVIRYVSYIRGILLSFIMFTTRVSIFISLIAYALLGNLVTADKAFVITAYYNILRQTMTVFFPQGIGQVAESLVSVRRIQAFMMYDEKVQTLPLKEYLASIDDETAVDSDDDEHFGTNGGTKPPQTTTPANGEAHPNPNGNNAPSNGHSGVNGGAATPSHLSAAGVNVADIQARWDPTHTEYTLNRVSLRVQPQTLVALIGPVGSGKSSLIQAILGELPIETGSIDVNGAVSYASQEPWLFSGTVRTNILFGQPMNRERYRQVVKKCALERDFALLPNGDKTIVGDRGQSLSGGQKARISLARACYRDAAIYLLDDPLSAVDTHVGKHLFDQCLGSLLKKKIVILVTHQLQYLQHVDQIVIFKEGRVEAVGTYDSLRQTGLDFAKLLADPGKDDETSANEMSSSRSRSGSRLRRANSEASNTSDGADQTGVENPMQVDEHRSEGAVGMTLYKQYFGAGGGFLFFYIMVTFCVVAQLSASGGDYFLSYWVDKEADRDNLFELGANDTLSENLRTVAQELSYLTVLWEHVKRMFGTRDDTINDRLLEDRLFDIYLFSGIVTLTVVITLSRSFLFFSLAMRASISLHNRMYQGVTRASMYFFNTNPSGRILNRFSKDMGQVDEILPAVMIDVIQIFLNMFGIIAVVAVVNHWLLVPTVAIGIVFYFLRGFYLKSSRDIKRMEATTRSPIYSHLGASLAGLSTIRAFGAEEILIREFDNLQDLNSSAFYMFITTSRAFGSWLDIFCVVYIAIVTVSFFVMDTASGSVGLAITQAISMTGMVQWGMRQSAELENTMTAVERVVEYETVDPEDELEAIPEKQPPPTWPADGVVDFDHVSLRYFPDPNADLVLKDLNFTIGAREKVGIVGRTGAGKSSLINALFRLSYNEGVIRIDGRDTQSMGLHDLRKKIAIIPQEPVLFSGTMRYNLDPFDEYTDEKLWSALEQVKLKQVIADLPSGLQSRITEGGGNFSVGQRQLVCLARAILRENRVLVMDEATANVDPQTDGLIQATIREQFVDCTILTIAHRLHTVMDCDKVLVMDAGRVMEFGSPYQLLMDVDGPRVFHGMVQEMGASTYASLLAVAKQAEERQNREKIE